MAGAALADSAASLGDSSATYGMPTISVWARSTRIRSPSTQRSMPSALIVRRYAAQASASWKYSSAMPA